jgi:hypothetical protein
MQSCAMHKVLNSHSFHFLLSPDRIQILARNTIFDIPIQQEPA